MSRRRRTGPRGLQGIFGWTFFDPANLVSIALLGGAAALSLHTLRTRDRADVPMAVLLYLCQAGLLRGYFFNYYNGRAFGRVLLLLANLLGLLGTAALWFDRGEAFSALRPEGVRVLAEAPALRWAGALHAVVAGTLSLHLLVPRRWMIRATDELADRSGMDEAHDAPLESIEDPERRAAVAAARAAAAARRDAVDAAIVDQVARGVGQVTRGVRRVTATVRGVRRGRWHRKPKADPPEGPTE